jgi:quinol-cytochrome oxidoreductase complex cytochrome b subunit
VFKEFLKHLFPRVVLQQNLRISYSFCLGGLAFTALLVLALSGLLLLFYYRPGAAEAYPSIIFLEESVYGGRYLRNLHRLASHAFLVCMFLHILRVVLTGAFAPPRQRNWIIGICLLGLGMFEAYTGYLLPMDQLALWATQTGMTLLEALPLGSFFKAILVPDSVGGPLSLIRFYVLHVVVLPLSTFCLCLLHFYLVRKQKGLLPYL